MTVIGGSSDHCIVDVEDCPSLQVGDIVKFSLCYSHAVRHGASDMRIIFKNQSAQEVKGENGEISVF